MRWYINKVGVPIETFDDGICEPVQYDGGPGPGPGCTGFTQDKIKAECERRHAEDPDHAYSFDFMDVTWPPVVPADPDPTE